MARTPAGARHRRRWLWLPVALVATLFASAALADPAADARALARLEQVLGSLDSVRAEFEQELIATPGGASEHASGTLYLRKPGRFRWDYSRPKQLIVCDGLRLWLYDPELEQATVRRVKDTLSQTPAMLLAGEARVRDGFTVRDGGRAQGLDWVVLVPKANDTDFREIRLALAGNTLRRIEFTDKLNQRTLIELKRLERNLKLPDSLFTFTPPPGVDVIGNAAH